MLDAAPVHELSSAVPASCGTREPLDSNMPLCAPIGHGADAWRRTIDEFTSMTARLLAVDACAIMLIAGHVDAQLTFRTHCSVSASDEDAVRDRIRQGESVARHAVRTGHSIAIDGSCGVTQAARSRTASPAERI